MLSSVQIDDTESVDIPFVEDDHLVFRLHELLRIRGKARYTHRETFVRGIVRFSVGLHSFLGGGQHGNLFAGFQRLCEVARILPIWRTYAREIGMPIFGARNALTDRDTSRTNEKKAHWEETHAAILYNAPARAKATS